MKPLRFILWEEWTNQSDTICITSLYYDPYYDVIDQMYPNNNPTMP
jgi:protease II